jgi:Uma2 family endonuclease
METPVVGRLMDSPDVYLIIEEMQALLADEQKSRDTFYADAPEDAKIEFINGVVVAQPAVMLRHSRACGRLFQLLHLFSIRYKLGYVASEAVMVALTRNDYRPDLCFFRRDKAEHFSADQILFPAPDLIAEVLSDETTKRDRGVKFTDYQAHGVQEYWIVDAERHSVEQYRLVNGWYELIVKSADGTLQSAVLKGFKIPVKAIFDDEAMMHVIRSISQGQPLA